MNRFCIRQHFYICSFLRAFSCLVLVMIFLRKKSTKCKKKCLQSFQHVLISTSNHPRRCIFCDVWGKDGSRTSLAVCPLCLTVTKTMCTYFNFRFFNYVHIRKKTVTAKVQYIGCYCCFCCFLSLDGNGGNSSFPNFAFYYFKTSQSSHNTSNSTVFLIL